MLALKLSVGLYFKITSSQKVFSYSLLSLPPLCTIPATALLASRLKALSSPKSARMHAQQHQLSEIAILFEKWSASFGNGSLQSLQVSFIDIPFRRLFPL